VLEGRRVGGLAATTSQDDVVEGVIDHLRLPDAR